MKIRFIGGASAILEHKGKRLLLDPSIDEGIFQGAWGHFPPLKFGVGDLPKIDYCFISHIHDDHCSAGTIKHLSPDCEIILMDRKPNFVLDYIRRNNFKFKKIHLVKAMTPQEIAPGMIVDTITEDPKNVNNFLIDSAMVMSWDGFTFYDANDCGPYPGGVDYILSRYKNIDLALLPYAGGSGYPACFVNLSHEEKMKERERIYQQCLQTFVSTTRQLNPRFTMPFADGFVIVGSRKPLNQYYAHPPGPGCLIDIMKKEGLSDKLLMLNSNQTFDFDTLEKTPNDPYRSYTESERKAYIEELSKDPIHVYDHEKIDFGNTVPIERLVTLARERLWAQQEKTNFFPDFRYYLATKDTRLKFIIDFRNREVVSVPFEAEVPQPFLGMSVPQTLLVMLLINHTSWNQADGAGFLDYDRAPNDYNPKVIAYYNYLRI